MKFIVYIILYPLYLFYQLIVSIRNYAYNINIFKTTKLNCKIISIGNVSMGGTGKTPIVIELAKTLQENHKVAILSRGYGRSTEGTQLVTNGNGEAKDWKLIGDEPALIAQNLSDVPIVVDENRVRGGQYLLDNFKPEVIILDDAFQHRKIHRDVDIVLISPNNAKPFNVLRESFSSLRRADLIFITKANNSNDTNVLIDRISKINSQVFESNISVSASLKNLTGDNVLTISLKGKSTLLVSGVGLPESFEKTVTSVGFTILDSISFKDHHIYTDADIASIKSRFKSINADIILTTEKDIIKFPQSELPIYAVPIIMDIAPAAIKRINKIFG